MHLHGKIFCIMTGTLYIVATPIGNLEDVTLRCINILSDVDIVLAEDTRVSRKLLDFIYAFNPKTRIRKLGLSKRSKHNFDISRLTTINPKPATHFPQLISYHQHSSEEKRLEILNYLLSGKNIALVTDAGTPGISDPGNELIDYLISYNPEIKIVPIPGPSAITAALSVCGFNTSKFTFIGFLPKKKSKKILEESLSFRIPVVYFESPYRIFKSLAKLEELKHLPARIFVGRELTKLHEATIRGTLPQVTAALEAQEKELGRMKGEIVVILEP